MTSPAPLLDVADLRVEFRTEDGVVHAVRGIDFSLERGEVLGIVGESGSGKSVTNLAILGLLPKTAKVSGSVRFEGTELIGLGDRAMNSYRGNRIAMIFQDPMTSLNPVHRVGRQIAEGIREHNDVSKAEATKRAVAMLDLVGIPNAAARADNYPHEFSGGMRQRVMIAMAMANDPDVLIADEPTTALDVTVQAQILETLDLLRKERGIAVILITHDLGVVANNADRLLVMYAGRVVEEGAVADVFRAPRMPYTIGLLGSLPKMNERDRRRLTPIPGSPPSLINIRPGCLFGPRCPIAVERCSRDEPPLVTVGASTQRSACHRAGDLDGAAAGALFDRTGAPA